MSTKFLKRNLKNSFLTLAIPTYNRGNILSGLLASIFEGLDDEIEVLVCDNNSIDNTFEVCGKYLSQKHFRYFRNKSNLGFDGNVLSTITHCKSEYIWFLSDDDFVTASFVNEICNYLKCHQPDSLLLNASVYDKVTNDLIIESLGSVDHDCIVWGDDSTLIENLQWSTLISTIILRYDNIELGNIQKFTGSCFIQLPIFWFSSYNKQIHLLGSKKVTKYNGEKDNFNLKMSEIWFKNWINVVNSLNTKYSEYATKFAATNLYRYSKFNTTGIILYVYLSRLNKVITRNDFYFLSQNLNMNNFEFFCVRIIINTPSCLLKITFELYNSIKRILKCQLQ